MGTTRTASAKKGAKPNKAEPKAPGIDLSELKTLLEKMVEESTNKVLKKLLEEQEEPLGARKAKGAKPKKGTKSKQSPPLREAKEKRPPADMIEMTCQCGKKRSGLREMFLTKFNDQGQGMPYYVCDTCIRAGRAFNAS